MHASLEIGLAFIEGLALILSPCILPVLPLILSTGSTGGRARPYGIILGFVLAFSVFVLLSRQIITALHIQPDVIRNVSLILLAVLGLVMLSDKLSNIFSAATQGFADIGSKFGGGAEGGFWSGAPMGALIGLVWTPCAGPVLAAVLVQVIRQQTDLQSVLVTLAFAIGASIPMLIITLTGRKLLAKATFITSRTELIRKVFGVLILIAVGIMAFGANAASLITNNASISQSTVQGLTDGLAEPYAAPELTGIEGWVNTKPFKLSDLRGKVVLVDFWTYSCINCVRTLPYVTAWDAKYHDKGLVIVGVHAPEFEFEKNLDNIKKAVQQYGVHYPVASDANLDTWSAFHNQYWPAEYLINQDGQVVYTHFGEGNYDRTENNIRYLLGLKKDGSDNVSDNAKSEPMTSAQTPETYLGYGRGERVVGDYVQGQLHDYAAAANLPQDQWTLGGVWDVERQNIVSGSEGATLQFHVNAKKVFLVMGTANGRPADVKIQLPGQTDKTIHVTGHALYTLAELPAAQSVVVKLTAKRQGVELYAFTFGN